MLENLASHTIPMSNIILVYGLLFTLLGLFICIFRNRMIIGFIIAIFAVTVTVEMSARFYQLDAWEKEKDSFVQAFENVSEGFR